MKLINGNSKVDIIIKNMIFFKLLKLHILSSSTQCMGHFRQFPLKLSTLNCVGDGDGDSNGDGDGYKYK